MNVFKRILTMVLSVAMIFSLCTMALAEELITIDTVTIQNYEDAYGNVDKDLATVVVEFTVPTTADQMTLLLTTEDITEISAETASKIIFMDQMETPEQTTYTFHVEKAKIKVATGLENIEGCTLYVKMGAKGVSLMDTAMVTYQDPATNVIYGDVTGDGIVDVGDAIKLLRYDAKLETLTPQEMIAAEVTGDGIVDIGDAIKILRFDAKLEPTLK